MNVRIASAWISLLHLRGEHVVDEALARDAREAREALRDDRGAEVAAARRRARVPRVQVALVVTSTWLAASSARRRASMWLRRSIARQR